MRALLALVVLLLPTRGWADDFRPDSSGAPIFRVFPLLRGASDQVILDHEHPLLSVEAVGEFLLKGDKRRVRVVLTTGDAQALTQILHSHEAVGLVAGGSTAIITGSHFDGSLTFDDPVAAYLRRRFHVKADSNDVQPPPPNPFAAPVTSP